jgi:hypothetical protein
MGPFADCLAGDEIFDVDGRVCLNLPHASVVELITVNQGTLSLTVRYTDDFRRAVLLKRLLAFRVGFR